MYEQFWAKVNIEGPEILDTPCWQWTGLVCRDGYGVHSAKRFGTSRAHRIAWMIVIGRKPAKMVLHKCDNRLCVNPAHLYEGTAKDNSKDCISRGRHRNQKVTHCPKGHEYSPGNTRLNGTKRICKTCHRDRERLRA